MCVPTKMPLHGDDIRFLVLIRSWRSPVSMAKRKSEICGARIFIRVKVIMSGIILQSNDIIRTAERSKCR